VGAPSANTIASATERARIARLIVDLL